MANDKDYRPGDGIVVGSGPDFLQQDDWWDADISADWLDMTKGYKSPDYTLSYKGCKFAPLGGIHALTGQPGNGKTMTFAQLIAAVLKGEYGDIKYELADKFPNPTVLYIDTEMEEGNTQLVALRVYEMLGWDKSRDYDEFKVLRLRETDRAEDRWRKTLKAIDTVKPTVCFIDGLLDIVADFNKNDECQDTIYKCMKTASHYGISLWCLVHENPGSTKMVGHLGSMLERKVTDAFGTIKEKTNGIVTFTIKQKKARGKDVPDIAFTIVDGPNGYGIPRQEMEPPQPASDEPLDYEIFVKQTIKTQDGITTRDFREAVKAQYHVGGPKADKILDELVDKKYVTRDEQKRYHIIDLTAEQTQAF